MTTDDSDGTVEPVPTGLWTEDRRLAALYDAECAGRHDHDFYLDLAARLIARRVTDIGCGTGVLAVELAARGHDVTGLDPAAAMLDIARARPGGDAVRWIEGFADRLPTAIADLVIMEGHVAQYFVADDAWAEVLAHAHRALVPGGHLAFESRNPAAREWETWTPEATTGTYRHPDGGSFTSWGELVALDEDDASGPIETHRGRSLLPDGQHLTADETLRFRPLEVLEASLAAAGFTVEATWGNWDRTPLRPDSRELILLARRRSRERPRVAEIVSGSERSERPEGRAG